MNSKSSGKIWLIWEDIRFGLRIFRNSPGFTAAAVATLALSIGATSAVFSIVNAVMLKPLPYPEPHRLLVMWGADKRAFSPGLTPVSDEARNKTMVRSDVAERWQDLSKSLDSMAWYKDWSFNATARGEPERVSAGFVSADFFGCLKALPVLGRTFVASDMGPGKDRVVVLGNAYWRRRFGADPQIVGQSIQLNGESHTVIGVLGQDFRALLPFIRPNEDLWVPVSRDYQGNRRWSTVTVFGRLKSGISQQQAQFEMNAISERLEAEGRKFQGRGVNLVRLDREVGSGSRLGLMIMFGAVACVLLIACANIAGLLLSRTQEREKEVGVRLALGATRGRILRQLLTESLLLSVIGGVAGTVLSVWIARAVVSLQPADIPRLDEVSADTRVLLFALGLTALTGILFGLLPAIQFSRASVVVALKQCSRLARRGTFLLQPRRVLLVGEVALALVLLVATGLLVRTFALLKSVNTGLETQGLLTLIVPLSETAHYGSSKQQAGFARDLLDRVRAIPGVESAAVSNSIPMQDRYVLGMRLQIDGRLLPEDTTVFVRAISPGYFTTMGIQVLKGRVLSLTDEGKENVVVINSEMAERFWPGTNPIGTNIILEDSKARTIIGVVANVKSTALDTPAESEVYLPFAEEPCADMGLALRSSGDLRTLAAAVRSAVRDIDPNQPISDVASMREMIDEFLARPRFNFELMGSFGALALLLSIIGIYTLVSRSVMDQTHEIGIRLALGARPGKVLLMFMREGAFLGLAGIALGLVGASVSTRLLAALLFGIPPEDHVTFAVLAAVLLVVCLSATYFPARQALKIDPTVALRHE